MSTIQENLQTIADSTAAIKQAIIDKGGEITGDITTWAEAINGISGGSDGSTEEELVFRGTFTNNKTLTGTLNYLPFPKENVVNLIYADNDMVGETFLSVGVTIISATSNITLSTFGVPSPSGWYLYGVLCRGIVQRNDFGTHVSSDEIKIAKIILE